MQLKNLNPNTGLRQVSSGYLCLPRLFIINLIKNDLKPLELGYFIIFLQSADWDTDKYRHGYIRHSLENLSKIWGLNQSTLTQNCNKLIEKNLIIKKNNTLMISNFERFTSKKAQQESKNKLDNVELQVLFPEIYIKYNEKSRNN